MLTFQFFKFLFNQFIRTNSFLLFCREPRIVGFYYFSGICSISIVVIELLFLYSLFMFMISFQKKKMGYCLQIPICIYLHFKIRLVIVLDYTLYHLFNFPSQWITAVKNERILSLKHLFSEVAKNWQEFHVGRNSPSQQKLMVNNSSSIYYDPKLIIQHRDWKDKCSLRKVE